MTSNKQEKLKKMAHFNRPMRQIWVIMVLLMKLSGLLKEIF